MSEQYHQLVSCAPLDEQRDYWRTELAGLAPVCFGDQPDPEAAAAGALDARITPEDVETCDAVARTAGATRFAALINAFAEGVATVTGARDFGIGIPATKRGSQQLSHGVNCLIDIICLRARPDPYAEPAAALRAAGERMRAALTGQDISFGEVVRLVSPPRGDRPPLYQLMFTLEPKNDPGLQLADCAVEFIRLDPPVAMTELGCALWPLPDGGYRAHLVYRPDRITRATVAAIGDAMLAAIRRAPRGAAPPLLTGWQGPASYFRFLECTSFDPAEAERVLRGERAGVVFRSAYPAQAVARALELFASHPAAARRDDDASGCYLGAYHYHKPTEQYLAQAAALRSALEEALWFDSSPWRSFREHLQAYFAGRGVEMRCAEQNGRRACLGVIRSWDRQGDFALVPHEDAAQCRHPAQAGFEIQRVLRHQVCAANLCLGNEGGGELIYWNLKPDDQARRAHRTYLTGGPYPASALRPAASIRLDVRPGDLYLFNGGHVHAVNRSRGLRATASTLLGFCDEHTLITWT
jgi:hypothetical protein